MYLCILHSSIEEIGSKDWVVKCSHEVVIQDCTYPSVTILKRMNFLKELVELFWTQYKVVLPNVVICREKLIQSFSDQSPVNTSGLDIPSSFTSLDIDVDFPKSIFVLDWLNNSAKNFNRDS